MPKPLPDSTWMKIAEQKIVEAYEKGEFENLKYFGKPLFIPETYDPDWWIKQKAKEEKLNVVPPGLELRRIVEKKLEEILAIADESKISSAVDRLNEIIRERNREIYYGPPSNVIEFSFNEILRMWREKQKES